MSKKTIFTALALGGAIVYALRRMTQSQHKATQRGPAKMGDNVRKMDSSEGSHVTG
jgi:hypothetical protein